MIFKSLPIQVDVLGRAHLRDAAAEAPFSFRDEARIQSAINRDHTLEMYADHPNVRNFSVDPLTRIRGNLSLQTVIDFEQRRVLDARVESTACSGYELILKGRPPSDAVQVTSRINGSSGGAHAIAACLALEMAGGVTPPPLAILTRNLGACGEMLSEGISHLFLLAGPDYSEAAVSRTSLSVWARAQRTTTPGCDVHGLETIADIMRGMNPIRGHLYMESLQMSRLASEIATMAFGKYPHPSSIFPGGVGIEPNREVFNQILGRVNTLLDYAKKTTAIWDDLIEFIYTTEPRYRRVGELPGNFLSVGLWDDPASYDASYQNCNEWGGRRLAPPGVIINNQQRTTRLSDVNIGIEEFIDHSYYAQWQGWQFPTDPMSSPLSPWHPWNKDTIPDPARRNWKDRYTWNTAPRWDREPMESGPIARLWINALSNKQSCGFIEKNGHGLKIEVPKGRRPATLLHWQIPERPNALERNRARAYHLAYTGMIAYSILLGAFDCLRRGETEMSRRFLIPEMAIGAGFWESCNGTITHHLVIDKHCIENYQVITPIEWMGSPRDLSGTPGIYEAALINTPLLEECARFADFTGIDILRTIRSFDP